MSHGRFDNPVVAAMAASVILGNRRLLKETEARVKERSGSDNVEARFLDLSKIDSIHNFVEGLIKDGIRLDASIMNAGVALPKARKTESGQDEMFLVNYLSNVMLSTNLHSRRRGEAVGTVI